VDEIDKMLGGLSGGAGGGDIVGSWVGKGPTKPVEPAALRAALGEEKVSQLPSQSGLSVESLLPMLAGALPAIIETITPNGNVPSGDATAGVDLGGLLEGLSSAASAGPNSPLAALGGLLGGPRG